MQNYDLWWNVTGKCVCVCVCVCVCGGGGGGGGGGGYKNIGMYHNSARTECIRIGKFIVTAVTYQAMQM